MTHLTKGRLTDGREIDNTGESLIAIPDKVLKARRRDGTPVCENSMARRKEQLERVTRRRKRAQDGVNARVEKYFNVEKLHEAAEVLLAQGRLTAQDQSIIEEM